MKLYRISEGRVNTDAVLQDAANRASLKDQSAPVTASAVYEHGSRFRIPVLVPVGVSTGDSRSFAPGSLSVRDLPLPLLWQFKTSSGHNDSVVIGRIDSVDVTDEGLVNAYGVLDTNPYAVEAERMIRNGFLRGVSADLDEFTANEEAVDESELSTDGSRVVKSTPLKIVEARLMGTTVVPMPAFQGSTIELIDELEWEMELMEDGIYTGEEEYVDSLVASAAPIAPPRAWFQNPKLDQPTPLTVEDDGRVFGHLALWEVSHIGMNGNVKPPRSKSDYKYFRSGVVRTAEGVDVTTGSITLTGGHAPMEFSANKAVQHYDDTKSAVIDVVAGEDKFGIWFSGVLRPDVTPEQIRALRASGVSGDWRPINGRLELVAACSVNVPGFPTVRAMVASGQVQSLVAAGTETLQEIATKNLFSKEFDSTLDKLNSRVDYAINKDTYESMAEDARQRMLSTKRQMIEAKMTKFKQESERELLEQKVFELRNRFNTD